MEIRSIYYQRRVDRANRKAGGPGEVCCAYGCQQTENLEMENYINTYIVLCPTHLKKFQEVYPE